MGKSMNRLRGVVDQRHDQVHGGPQAVQTRGAVVHHWHEAREC
jgi:hypothetical protein